MRIVIAPIGTPTDVLPMFALASVLHSRGHNVQFCAPEIYRSRIIRLGYEMTSAGESFTDLLEGDEKIRNRSVALARALSLEVAAQFVSLRDALREADVLVGSMLLLGGPSMAESFGIPYFYVVQSPVLLDEGKFPCFGVKQQRLPGWIDSLRRKRHVQLWDQLVGRAINRERENSGLNHVSNMHHHVFHSGRVLVSVDPDLIARKETNNHTYTGFWYWNETPRIDGRVEDALASGLPGVFLGPIRMDQPERLPFLRRLSTLAKAERIQFFMGANWKELTGGEVPPNFVLLDPSAYSAIFPQLRVIVHQGNTSMTAEATRAGVPQVIAPYWISDHFWAEQVHGLGLGPGIVTTPTPERIMKCVRQALSNQTFAANARSKKEKVLQRDGLLEAAQMIESRS